MTKKIEPFFLIGYPRSGTTLLLHVLMASGCFPVYKFNETHFFSHYYRRFGNLKNSKNRALFLEAVFNSDWFLESGVCREKIANRFAGQDLDYAKLLVAIMEEISLDQGYDRWLEKTPWHILYTQEIRAFIPDSKFILIVRDPRDVALSISKYGWNRGMFSGPVRAAIAWSWHMDKITKEAYGNDQFLVVKYEELVENMPATIKTIGRFLEVEMDYEVISNNAVGVLKESNSSFKREKSSSPVNRWKSTEDKKLIMRMEYALRGELEKYGYSESGLPSLSLIDQLKIRSLKQLYALGKLGRQLLFPIVRK